MSDRDSLGLAFYVYASTPSSRHESRNGVHPAFLVRASELIAAPFVATDTERL
jgi:hypothetical protein